VIRVVVDDLAFLASDAVVRPATATLEPTSHALRRLEEIGGPSFWKQIDMPTRLAVGAAVVTGAGNLPSEIVIQAVGRTENEPVTPTGIRLAITSVLQRAADWEFSSITTPLLGTGPGNLSTESAAQILVDAYIQNLSSP